MNDTLSTQLKTDPEEPVQRQKHFVPFKECFNCFLEGKLTTTQLITAANYPCTAALLPSGKRESLQILTNLVKFRSKIKGNRTSALGEERKGRPENKLSVLNSLIKRRVQQKKPLNDQLRQSDLQNVGLLRTIAEASDSIKAQIGDPHLATEFERRKALKTMTVSFHSQKLQSTKVMKSPFLKFELEDSAKEFLSSLEEQQSRRQMELDRITKRQIEQKNKSLQTPFELYNKEVMTYKDVELYDYIHNKPIQVQYNCVLDKDSNQLSSPRVQGDWLRQSMNRKLQRRVNIQKSRNELVGLLKQKSSHYHTSNEHLLKRQQLAEDQEVSASSSLQSMYEVQLENMYGTIKDLKARLSKPENIKLTKRIRQIMKLDEVGQRALAENKIKLFS